MGYDLLVEKIRLLRGLGDLEKLRSVRERLNEYYPLSPQLWMDWLRDESKVAKTDEEKEEVLKLFQRSVEDYLCKLIAKEFIVRIVSELITL